MSKRSRRALLLLPLLAALAGGAVASCADPVDGPGSVRARPDTPPLPVAAAPAATPEEAAATDPAGPPEPAADAPPDRIMQGPWRVVCFQEEEVVFRHDRIFRVWDADNEPPQWVYQTEDGVRFRGRMGTDLNCTFQRLDS
jgi:hypothetical protein